MAIYAVDFDGTLAVTRFPEIVEPKRKIVAAVKMLKANGHKVILWTSRAGRDLEAAVEWCHGQGLEFEGQTEVMVDGRKMAIYRTYGPKNTGKVELYAGERIGKS